MSEQTAGQFVDGRSGGASLLLARAASLLRGRNLVIATLVLLLGFLTVYPLSMLFYGSLHSTPPGAAGVFNLDGYRAIVTSRNALILLNTVGLSFANTIPSISLAVLLAWIIARTDTPGRGTLEVLITLPFFVPPILTAMAWGMLGNQQVGLINQAWKAVTGSQTSPFNVYSYAGVVWHMSQYATTFLFLFLVDAFRAMDPALEEASRMCGASRWTTFRKITLFLLLPVLTSGFILSIIRGIESFESPLFFGTPVGIKVISTEIYDSINQRAVPAYQPATALAFVIMLLLFSLIVWQWVLLRGKSFQTVTGKGFNPGVIRLGAWRWLTFAICALFFVITTVLPIGQLMLGSFFQFFGFYGWNLLTLDHYREVLGDSLFWRATRNTMLLGLVGATATMILGSVVAYVSVRTKWRGRRLIDAIAWLPWLMPGIVLAVGFLWGFAMLPASVPIYGTIWALFLAYLSLGTPISVRVMSGAYAQLSYDLEECSRVHGANFFQTMTRILVALAWPAFAVGWVLAFFGIMRELSASILLYSTGSEVLSIVLLQRWSNGLAEEVSVIGLMMMCLVIVFRWVQLVVIKRRISTL